MRKKNRVFMLADLLKAAGIEHGFDAIVSATGDAYYFGIGFLQIGADGKIERLDPADVMIRKAAKDDDALTQPRPAP
ncbi:MAG: hypothetical protein KGL39_57685 [Patescibacteria group bacterium]|nr:hypothetical protein [Patescibacteria group bacterium]